jgi:hypothetical protein
MRRWPVVEVLSATMVSSAVSVARPGIGVRLRAEHSPFAQMLGSHNHRNRKPAQGSSAARTPDLTATVTTGLLAIVVADPENPAPTPDTRHAGGGLTSLTPGGSEALALLSAAAGPWTGCETLASPGLVRQRSAVAIDPGPDRRGGQLPDRFDFPCRFRAGIATGETEA